MDYADILRALASTDARFAVAGGFASLAHGVNEDLLERVTIFGVEVLVLRKEELIRLKRLAGRDKDLADVRELEKLT